MREFDLLQDYPKLKSPRLVGDNLRTIDHRIIAAKRDHNFDEIEILVMEDSNTMEDGKTSQKE